MASTWTALPHGPIEKLEDNLWRVEGTLPKNPPFKRVMTVVRLGDGRLVVHNAICLAVMNVRPASGFMGFIMGLVGFTGDGPKVSGPAKFFIVKDKAALRANLERLAALPNLSRVVVSHGAPFGADGLRTAAATL